MCMVEGIRVLCAWERSRVYRLGMGEKFTFYVQMIWDRDESMTVNERGKEGRNQMGQNHLKQSQNPSILQTLTNSHLCPFTCIM